MYSFWEDEQWMWETLQGPAGKRPDIKALWGEVVFWREVTMTVAPGRMSGPSKDIRAAENLAREEWTKASRAFMKELKARSDK
jgi:hypothetical protein